MRAACRAVRVPTARGSNEVAWLRCQKHMATDKGYRVPNFGWGTRPRRRRDAVLGATPPEGTDNGSRVPGDRPGIPPPPAPRPLRARLELVEEEPRSPTPCALSRLGVTLQDPPPLFFFFFENGTSQSPSERSSMYKTHGVPFKWSALCCLVLGWIGPPSPLRHRPTSEMAD